MRTIAIVLLGLAVAQAVFVKRNSDPNQAIFAQLESFEDHELGRKLLDTIALQLNNKAPLGDIAKMLQQLRENLVLNQQEADQKHAQEQVDCEVEVYQYNKRIDYASNEIQESVQEITTLSSKVSQLTTDIDNKVIQLDILNEQQTLLTQQREDDNVAFKNYDAETEGVIDAVEVIISKLGSIQPEQEVLAALTQLNKIENSNPIFALMQVASTFSADQLENVIRKLAEVNASIESALQDARENETQAALDFEALVIEIEAQRESLSAARDDSERQLLENQQALDLQKKRMEDATLELQAATSGKEQKEDECDNENTEYTVASEHRSEEITIIRSVEEILATKLSGVKVYLQTRQTQ